MAGEFEEFMCRATQDWSATVADELDLKEGEEYVIMLTSPSGWWYAVNTDGDDGWVTSQFLIRIDGGGKESQQPQQQQQGAHVHRIKSQIIKEDVKRACNHSETEHKINGDVSKLNTSIKLQKLPAVPKTVKPNVILANLKFKSLSPHPIWTKFYPQPLFWRSPENECAYIIFVPDASESQGIWVYDIEDDTFEQIIEYPFDFKPTNHAIYIDHDKAKLYIFTHQLIVLDLIDLTYSNRKQMMERSMLYHPNTGINPIINVKCIMNDIFIFTDTNKQWKYDKEKDVVIELYLKMNKMPKGQILCVNGNKFYSLATNTKQTNWSKNPLNSFVCNIHDLEIDDMKWQNCGVKLPKYTVFTITVMNWIVIAFQNNTPFQIWYCDFGPIVDDENDAYKWILVELDGLKKGTSNRYISTRIVGTDDHKIHYFMTQFGRDVISIHRVFDVKEIIPNALYQKYTIQLVNGFVYLQLNAINIPYEIIHLISDFVA